MAYGKPYHLCGDLWSNLDTDLRTRTNLYHASCTSMLLALSPSLSASPRPCSPSPSRRLPFSPSLTQPHNHLTTTQPHNHTNNTTTQPRNRTTYRVNTFRRLDLIEYFLEYYSTCDVVAQVQVVWSDQVNNPPHEVFTPIHLYTYAPTHLHTYTPTHLHTYTPTQLHTYTPIHLHNYTHIHLCTYALTFLHTYTPTPIHLHTCTP
jgi:hypothetical protein